MGYLTNKITDVINSISVISEIPEISVVKEFPAVIKDNPLNGIIVSYGIDSLNTNYQAPGYEGMIYTEIKVIFTIHAPLTYSGEDCQKVFMQIIEMLNADMPLFSIYGCGNPKFERNTATLVLEGFGIIKDGVMFGQ